MEKKYYINMDSVDMSYPSNVYNARSIKEDFFSIIKRNHKKELLVGEGERVGVIGHNGAGKSTLLKTISGIYPIERGTIDVQGKIRALFDISLGFDLESTGRENILYRGLLLGASPDEMKEKMEEIVAFADIGEFIDYPVKAYSTGMAVRLAFAVSTCIDGDVLLLDEILGAGDAEFQVKAKKRIFDLMDNSKLMVLVTHDLEAAVNICSRVILMQKGTIVYDGDPKTAVNEYKRIREA